MKKFTFVNIQLLITWMIVCDILLSKRKEVSSMAIIRIMVSALLGAVLTWATSSVLYKKQSTIEMRWTLFQTIRDEMYASKKLIAVYFNELGNIAADMREEKEVSEHVHIDFTDLSSIHQEYSILTNKFLAYMKMYEPGTICKTMAHLPFVFKSSARKMNFYFYLETWRTAMCCDLKYLLDVENKLQDILIPYFDKTAAPDIYDEILAVIGNVHASDMQTLDLDEIGLYDFMAESFRKIV